MSIPCWVLGAGGMLGSALGPALQERGRVLFATSQPLPWLRPSELSQRVAKELDRFSLFVSASGDVVNDPWEIVWAAGVGNFRSSADEMQPELVGFKALLTALAGNPVLAARCGRLGLASSAGALHAGCTDWIIDEHSALLPRSPYGKAKLLLEQAVRRYLAEHDARRNNEPCAQHSGLIARMSTLYGANQSTGKAQGLLSHLARCIVRGQAVHIFVPLDTIRDYLTVDDAAVRMSCALEDVGSSRSQVRIIASEMPTTVSEILMTFRRVAHRAPRIVISRGEASALYSRIVQFRSRYPGNPASTPRTPLLLGVAQLLKAERRRFTNPGAAANGWRAT